MNNNTASLHLLVPLSVAAYNLPMPRTVHAVCPHDCPDSCAVLITVDDLGRATKLQGDSAHPVTRGFLCARSPNTCPAFIRQTAFSIPYIAAPAPSKAAHARKTPLSASTWDEALSTIAARFRSIADEFGPEAILPYSYAGTTGTLAYGSMDRRFFHRLGASQLDRTICSTAGGEALISVYGRKLGTDIEAFPEAKYIIAWGANIHGNNVHLWPFIEEARRKGAKFVVLDPYKTRTARCADWYLPINPGTDLALAMSMMHVMIDDDLIDAAYVRDHTEGFDELAQIVTAPDYAPERIAPITGIAAADIRTLAREFATTTPAVIRLNYGVQRTDSGGSAVRAIAMLPVITGQFRHYGGGLQLSTSGAFGLNQQRLQRPDLMQLALGRPARTINMSQLGSALTTLDSPPVKAIYVYNSNPAAVAPDSGNVLRGLARPDLFTVVHEQYLTDTTDYADIVLPATTFFEHKDLQTAYGHYYLQLSSPAIAPLGEARDNVTVFRDLAQAMGFDDDCLRATHDELISDALASDDHYVQGITLEQLESEHRVRLNFESWHSGEDSLPSPTALPHSPAARPCCATPHSPTSESTPYSPTTRPSNPARAKKRNSSPSNSSPAKPTTISTPPSPISPPIAPSNKTTCSRSTSATPRHATSVTETASASSTTAAPSNSPPRSIPPPTPASNPASSPPASTGTSSPPTARASTNSPPNASPTSDAVRCFTRVWWRSKSCRCHPEREALFATSRRIFVFDLLAFPFATTPCHPDGAQRRGTWWLLKSERSSVSHSM